MQISIIIPVYNNTKDLPYCPSGVKASAKNLDAEIIVVDDAPTDETPVGGRWSVDPTHRPALCDTLVAAYHAWRAGTLAATTANPRKLGRFSRRHLASELATRFESLRETAAR